MARIRETQSRLVYSLLRSSVRVAAHFRVPMQSMSEILRLACYEVLRRQGLTQVEVGRRLGQTDRHMRSAAQKLRSNFFAAERHLGLLREIEKLVGEQCPLPEELTPMLLSLTARDIQRAVDDLLAEGRVCRDEDGRLRLGARYVLLASDQFHKRIDALNHYLDGVHQAVMHRLVHNEERTAMLKTISFSAPPEALAALVARFEVRLRREIADLEEQTRLEGGIERLFTLGVALAPSTDRQVEDA